MKPKLVKKEEGVKKRSLGDWIRIFAYCYVIGFLIFGIIGRLLE